MKEIENKITSIKNSGENKEEKPFVEYSDFIKGCVNNIGKSGFSSDDIRKRARILDALDNQKDGKILLEDADLITLKGCIKIMQWAFMHRDILKFVDYIEKC